MNIVVLNGSPKGLTSVTVQYVRYLQQKLPQHTFAIHHVASELRQLEERPAGISGADRSDCRGRRPALGVSRVRAAG